MLWKRLLESFFRRANLGDKLDADPKRSSQRGPSFDLFARSLPSEQSCQLRKDFRPCFKLSCSLGEKKAPNLPLKTD